MSENEISNPRVVVVTQKSDPDRTIIHDYLVKYDLPSQFCLNNTESLTKRYNEALDSAKEDGVDCLILVHDDVILQENPLEKLKYLFTEYDLVGVAGTSKITLQSPALWHLMGGGFGGGKLHGCVSHQIDGQTHPTYFGQYPSRVVMIDGVFMALNRTCIEFGSFDENIPSKFHFYDLDFSLACHKQGMRVGVGDIQITHLSPGLRSFTDEWKQGEQYFLQKYE